MALGKGRHFVLQQTRLHPSDRGAFLSGQPPQLLHSRIGRVQPSPGAYVMLIRDVLVK